MATLAYLFSQYELLRLTANYLTFVDLYHLASTCTTMFAQIRKCNNIYAALKRLTLCDGSGRRARLTEADPYGDLIQFTRLRVRLDAERKCDVANTKPCIKCGVNICAECRCVPRYKDPNGRDPPSRRPHYGNIIGVCDNVIAYCGACDPEIEAAKQGAFCDCDRYVRWICVRCHSIEIHEDHCYYFWCNDIRTREDPALLDSGIVLADSEDGRPVNNPQSVPK